MLRFGRANVKLRGETKKDNDFIFGFTRMSYLHVEEQGLWMKY